MDPGRIVVDNPPEPPARTPVSPLARLMPVAMIVAMAGMTVLYLTSSGSSRNPMFLFFPVMMMVSLVGTLAATGRDRGGDLDGGRTAYLRHLDTVEAALLTAADEQCLTELELHPDPAALWTLAGSARMWARTEDDPQFGVARIGMGEQPAAVTVVAPALGSDEDADPVTTGAVRRLLRHHAAVGGLPVTVRLPDTRLVTVTGDPAQIRDVARALVCQLATHHHPRLVTIGAARPAPHWEWLKWLPHQTDRRPGRCHLLLVEDGGLPEPADGVTVVVMCAAPGAEVEVHADGRRLAAEYDRLAHADAVACARRLARHRTDAAACRVPGTANWPALMGIDDPEAIDPAQLWSGRTAAGLLRVPIGIAEDGSVVELDIKEAAAGGLGPHGLCVGATGSGKSEFLRTLALGMVAAHPPEVLNLVLVDFKGGATFLGLDGVEHVSAVITNLADEAPLVSRMREALTGEINRRQQILRAAGNLANLAEYRRARDRSPTLAPLPALLIIVDEFSELLTRHPDFAELFVAIGRLGRSLGMHLLLASQRLDEGRLRGLETHLSYRICLKTFSAAESRAVLGVPDAHHLPAQPGAAYLSTASGTLTRFQTAFVSGRFPVRGPHRDDVPAVRPFTLTGGDGGLPPQTSRRPLLDAVLDRLRGAGTAAHRVWLPPLDRSPRLAEVLAGTQAGRLRVPIGVVDRPFEQRRDPLIVDLSGAAGNVAVVGAPRSGKSTTLRTLIGALAATHSSSAVQFYCVDFGGGDLAALRDLPHVGAVAGRGDADLCRRIVAQLESVLRSREKSGGAGDDPYGDVVLVIDGWAALRQDFDGLENTVTMLAAQGLAYGVHVMIAAARWADLRPALKDQIGTRIELRLGDPTDSEMDRRRAKELTDRPPGRGITADGREMVVATPDSVAVQRDGRPAPPVELLPMRVDRAGIGVAGRRRGEVLLGLGERDLAPVTLDFAEHPHLLVLGDGECGKTALLRLLCTELVAAVDEPHLEIVDFRRTLLGVVDSGPRTGYAVSGVAVASRMAVLTERLNARMPDEFVTQQQLRDRSWWSGPDIYVVVDDYDLVAGATGNPLTPLADFLPHAKDLGLRVILARRSGGAARALFDPVPARMRDMGCVGLMMSAAPDEGVLLGTVRPTPLPPGRATLIVRGRPDELVQTAWVQPP